VLKMTSIGRWAQMAAIATTPSAGCSERPPDSHRNASQQTTASDTRLTVWAA
jgi:hypothetical protein